ncbi:formyl transferase [Thalassotalea psychrophila]|uniref:Formyl transferase n=1 Tax=Thalassotalea psychrophila TaxID=3065647 RepID=A0ABY9TZ34_9GAMM|nr:formyl transferase [Colwelliaceae bacterium SQ149]
MNITILANRDIASNFAINLLLPHLNNHNITIFLSAKVGQKTNKPAALLELAFYEQELFNRILSPKINAQHSEQTGFNTFEQLHEIVDGGVRELNNINTEEGLNVFKPSQPDLVISIRYGVIIKSNIINVPRNGVINLHSGILPDYRGVMATFWAMYKKEQSIGMTLHYISDGTIDTGRVIGKSFIDVNYQKSYLWHVLELYKEGTQLIINVVNKINQNLAISSTAQEKGGDYYSFPTTEEVETFINAGNAIISELEVNEFINQYYRSNVKLSELTQPEQ